MKYWDTKDWEVLEVYKNGYGQHGSGLNIRGPRNIKTVTNYKLPDGSLVSELELTKDYFTLIDTEDLDYVCQMNWCASKTQGKFKRAMSKRKLLHQWLSDKYWDGQVIDHVNEDYPLSYEFDNRKCNLRPTNPNSNAKNLSRLKSNNTTGEVNIRRNTHETCWCMALRHRMKDSSINFPDKEFKDGFQQAILARDILKPWLISQEFDKEPEYSHLTNKETRFKIRIFIDKILKQEGLVK